MTTTSVPGPDEDPQTQPSVPETQPGEDPGVPPESPEIQEPEVLPL